jgi:hypothetical protein
LLPVAGGGGTGLPYIFSYEGLVYSGVLDELLSIGVYKAGLEAPRFEFIPASRRGKLFRDLKKRTKSYQTKGKRDEERVTDEGQDIKIAFLKAHDSSVRILAQLRHIEKLQHSGRRSQRYTRKFYVKFQAHPQTFPEVTRQVQEPNYGVAREGRFAVVTSAWIDVLSLRHMVDDAVGQIEGQT